MSKLIKQYRISKYKHLVGGLLFAIISMIAIIFSIYAIINHVASETSIILSFFISVISLFMGFIAMFYNNERSSNRLCKIQKNGIGMKHRNKIAA